MQQIKEGLYLVKEAELVRPLDEFTEIQVAKTMRYIREKYGESSPRLN